MTEAEFLAQYMLPDDERKRLLIGNALLGLGSGLMQSKRGGELTNAGLGLFAGAQQGQNAIFDAQRGQVDKVKLKQMWQEGEDKKAQQTAAADFSRRLSEVDANPQGMKQWEMAMRKAQMAADAGDVKRAEEYRKAAEFYRVKFNPTAQVVMKDGKPTLVQTSEYGDTNELNQYAPQPKFREVNDGKTTRILNDYQLPETGANIPMQTTPGQDQSAALQRAQMAQSERHFQTGQAQNAVPAWVNDLDRGLQVDPRSGQTRPITANGAPVGAKGASKQADQSKIALTIIGEAKSLIDKSTGSYIGAGVDQAARVFGGSTAGAEAAAQLQALEGALMLNQPRMEGPQSDKDTALYKQMAAKIGDPTVPNAVKKAALDQVEKLHKKYASGVSAGGASGGWSITPAD